MSVRKTCTKHQGHWKQHSYFIFQSLILLDLVNIYSPFTVMPLSWYQVFKCTHAGSSDEKRMGEKKLSQQQKFFPLLLYLLLFKRCWICTVFSLCIKTCFDIWVIWPAYQRNFVKHCYSVFHVLCSVHRRLFNTWTTALLPSCSSGHYIFFLHLLNFQMCMSIQIPWMCH